MPQPEIDAILCPLSKIDGADLAAHAAAAKRLFAKPLGAAAVYVRNALGGLLCTREAEDTRFARDGRERYEWTDRGDGVLYGKLVLPTPPAPAQEAPGA